MSIKGISIVGTVGIMLILSILGIVGVSLLGSTSSLALDYLQSQQAFYNTEAGLKWYLQQLKNDADWSNNAATGDKGPKDFAGGTFTITVSQCFTDSITVTSAGAIIGYESQPVQRKSTISVTRSQSFDGYGYAIYVGGTIDTAGSENLVISGNQKNGATDLPTVDFAYYQSIAEHVISQNYTFTAGQYSGLWYIDGNATVDSGVTLNGGIIATGNISMNGSTNIAITAVSPYPALVTNSNFLFQNTDYINITGLIYVGANFTGNFLSQKAQNINITGTIFVGGNLNLQNTKNVSVTYDASIIDNTPPGFTCPGGTSSITTTGWKEIV